MSSNRNESFGKSLVLSLLPVIVGTLIFGMFIESYKSDLNFRADIMKEYYMPLINKERECGNISNKLSYDFTQKVGLYTELSNRYNSIKDGSGPRLTDEYKSYLTSLLKNSSEFNENSNKHSAELSLCRQELKQIFVNIGLVTGTITKFHYYNQKLDESLSEIDKESEIKSSEIRKLLSTVDIDRIISELYILGDPGDKRYWSNDSNHTDQVINPTMKKLIDFFAYRSSLENRINQQYIILYKSYNPVLEKEISSRYQRSWISRVFG